jgi:hypothetical protein
VSNLGLAERMNRIEKLLSGLDISTLNGLEFVPQCAPIVAKSDGAVRYVDHVDTDALKSKYASDPNVRITEVVSVDIVWEHGKLAELVGPSRIDYAVASHVIEHVPDLVGWLREIEAIFHESSELRLAVPDKRFTFDHFRSTSSVPDVLAAYVDGADKPSTRQMLDHFWFSSEVDLNAAWRGELTSNGRAFAHTLSASIAMAEEAKRGVYHDVHCWVFTPVSFAILMANLCFAGLLKFGCTQLIDTEYGALEFFVGMGVFSTYEEAGKSWLCAALSAQQKSPGEVGSPPLIRLNPNL